MVPRAGATGSDSGDERRATAGDDGLRVQYQELIANDDVVVEVADHPATLGALAGSAVRPPFTEGSRQVFLAPDSPAGPCPRASPAPGTCRGWVATATSSTWPSRPTPPPA